MSQITTAQEARQRFEEWQEKYRSHYPEDLPEDADIQIGQSIPTAFGDRWEVVVDSEVRFTVMPDGSIRPA